MRQVRHTIARSAVRTVPFLVLALVAAPQARGADLATWDQEKVTAIAEEIAQAARELRDSLRRKPPPSLGQSGRRAFWSLREEMQVLVSASRRLHGALAEGAGREETFSTYRRLLSTAQRAGREARRIDLGEPVLGRIDAAADAIRRIRPFYEAEPPL